MYTTTWLWKPLFPVWQQHHQKLRTSVGYGGESYLLPVFIVTLSTSANFHFLLALLTANFATPVELAMTVFFNDYLFRGVASTTAQELASVNSAGRFLANPTRRPERATRFVRRAEVWRRIKVDQVRGSGRFKTRIFGHQDPSCSSDGLFHQTCSVELFFQFAANSSDRR